MPKTIADYLKTAPLHQAEGRSWSQVEHEHLKAWQAELERQRAETKLFRDAVQTLMALLHQI